MSYYNGPRCGKCGSRKDKEHHAFLLGRSPYEKECPLCGAELCPKCGHRRSAHRVLYLEHNRGIDYFHPFEDNGLPRHYKRDNLLQERCAIMTSETTDCNCEYYSCDIDKEMIWDIISLGSGTMDI
jgi:hypothetical protein